MPGRVTESVVLTRVLPPTCGHGSVCGQVERVVRCHAGIFAVSRVAVCSSNLNLNGNKIIGPTLARNTSYAIGWLAKIRAGTTCDEAARLESSTGTKQEQGSTVPRLASYPVLRTARSCLFSIRRQIESISKDSVKKDSPHCIISADIIAPHSVLIPMPMLMTTLNTSASTF
jgi:hypothetical protein